MVNSCELVVVQCMVRRGPWTVLDEFSLPLNYPRSISPSKLARHVNVHLNETSSE